MTKQATTLVTFLLDRSGSMGAGKHSTIEAYNAYIDTLKADKGDGFVCEFTFLQFDSQSLDKIYLCEPIKNVVHLTDASYQPRGGTPLIDSCMKTIMALEDSLSKRDDKPKIVVCFQTDGEENASRQFTSQQLKVKIEELTAKGWQFNFMGAGIDGYGVAASYGIGASSTMSYDRTNTGNVKAAFAATASNARGFGTGALRSTMFSGAQRTSSGDHFASADLMKDAGAVDLTPRTASAPLDVDLTKTISNVQAKSSDLNLSR